MGQRAQPGRSREGAGRTIDTLAGRNAVREALLANRRRIHRVVVAEGVQESGAIEDILRLAAERGLPLQRAPRAELDRLEDALVHQGVIAQCSPYPYVDLDDLLRGVRGRQEAPFLLALDSVQDPQNLGALLRTAEAVGVHGVIIPRHRAAGITPAASRASAGAAEHVLVAEVTNLTRTLVDLKESGIWVVGVEVHPSAQDYLTVSLDMPLALVVGGEGQGMRRLARETCDLLVRLPMRGRVTSLNVSVAGSVVLYKALQDRALASREA